MNDTIKTWLPSLALLIAIGATSPALSASSDYPKYRITEVGDASTGAFISPILNASGQITGDISEQAYIWLNDGTPIVNIFSGVRESLRPTRSTGTGVNNAGQVAGWGRKRSTVFAFIWKNDGTPPLQLGTLGGSTSYGSAINDLGQVAGWSYTQNNVTQHAFLWENDGHPMRDLGTLGGQDSIAIAINATGEVTGYADTHSGDRHAFLWKNDGKPMKDLGTVGGDWSQPITMNASGQVTGVSTVDADGLVYHAFLWRNDGSPMVDLGALDPNDSYNTPTKVNASGEVVGSEDSGVTNVYRAFLWRNDGTPMFDLGNLSAISADAWAEDINDSGWVVGISAVDSGYNHAFLWKDNGQGMKDLNDLIDPSDPLKSYITLDGAQAINDAGDIVAVGGDSRTGEEHTYLLRGSTLVISPRSLAFGNRKPGMATTAKSVTVQNITASAVPITSIAIAGSAANQFISTNNCDSSVVGNGSCTIKVTFKPTTKGTKSATLNVNGGGGGLRVVNLTGTGT